MIKLYEGTHFEGRNDYGQLGLGDTNNLGDDPAELPAPDLQLGGQVSSVVAGTNQYFL